MQELCSLNDDTIRVQDKGSRFVLLTNEQYCEKVQYQINRSSFILLNSDPTKISEDKINTWIEKWINRKAIDKNWKRFIKLKDIKPGKMYGMIKTHKENNPARIITSGSRTTVENLSIFVEKCLFLEVLKIDTRVRDMQHMLTIVNDLNKNGNLHENCLLVSFHVVIMFPSIDNKMGIESVKSILLNRDDNRTPAECVIETLELCLNCNNSIFNNQHYFQVDGTAQGLHMSCSYSDIAMYSCDLKALSYVPTVKYWKHFRVNVFDLWEYSRDDLEKIFNFMNSIDSSKKIQFTKSF